MEIEEAFAYPSFRPGQKEFAVRVHNTSSQGGILMAEAMSGFGKTAAVLTGVVSAAEETGSRVVYACRTKRQILRIVEEITTLQRKHAFAAASLLSKFDYCLLKETSPRQVSQPSFGWYCWFNVHNNLCSYFLNVGLLGVEFENEVRGILHRMPSHEELLGRCRSAYVCPYEVERLAVSQAELAVVPYHYVFDPNSAPALFDRNFLEKPKTILVVDEAHNLRDFLRDVNSASLTFDQLEGAVLEARSLMMEKTAVSLEEFLNTLRRIVEGTSSWLLNKEQLIDEFRRERGAAWLQNLSFELTACSEAAWGSVAYERRLPSLLLKVGQFLVRLSTSTRAVLVKWERTVALIDPNPVADAASFLGEFKAAILVSATMNPSAVFARSLGLGDAGASTYSVTAEPSVFIKTVVETGVTTKYKARSPSMYSRIAEKVACVIRSTAGGVGVFAPSYAVLEPISEMVTNRVSGRNFVSEVRGLSSHDSTALFESFRSHPASVLFAVQGGRFSEGEDFRENLMDTAIVIGLSLPPPTPMLYAEYACLKRTGEVDAYLMLSRLPALRKAFQAAGRHLRRPGKRGMVFLMDHRFDSESVRSLMPSWMKHDLVSGDFTSEQLTKIITGFWDSA